MGELYKVPLMEQLNTWNPFLRSVENVQEPQYTNIKSFAPTRPSLVFICPRPQRPHLLNHTVHTSRAGPTELDVEAGVTWGTRDRADAGGCSGARGGLVDGEESIAPELGPFVVGGLSRGGISANGR